MEAFARAKGLRFFVILTAFVDSRLGHDKGSNSPLPTADEKLKDLVADRAHTLGQPSTAASLASAKAAEAAKAAEGSSHSNDSSNSSGSSSGGIAATKAAVNAHDSASQSTDPMHGSSASEAIASGDQAHPTAVGAAPASAGSHGTFKREITIIVLDPVPEGVAGSSGPTAPAGIKPAEHGGGQAVNASTAAPSQPHMHQAFVERSPNVAVAGSRALAPDALLQALVNAFETEPQKQLDAVRSDDLLPKQIQQAVSSKKHGLRVATLNQRNTKGSRKQVAPLIEGLLSKL